MMLSCWPRIRSDSLFKRFTAVSLMKIQEESSDHLIPDNASAKFDHVELFLFWTETKESGQGEQRARTTSISMRFNPS